MNGYLVITGMLVGPLLGLIISGFLWWADLHKRLNELLEIAFSEDRDSRRNQSMLNKFIDLKYKIQSIKKWADLEKESHVGTQAKLNDANRSARLVNDFAARMVREHLGEPGEDYTTISNVGSIASALVREKEAHEETKQELARIDKWRREELAKQRQEASDLIHWLSECGIYTGPIPERMDTVTAQISQDMRDSISAFANNHLQLVEGLRELLKKEGAIPEDPKPSETFECEFIDVVEGQGHCWAKISDSMRVRVSLPLAAVEEASLQAGDKFIWHYDEQKAVKVEKEPAAGNELNMPEFLS